MRCIITMCGSQQAVQMTHFSGCNQVSRALRFVKYMKFKLVWCLDPGSTCARSSARKQHALVCDRLNYTLYKIVNNICILYTRLVFPTVKGKSLGWKHGGPHQVLSVNLWEWDHLLAGGFNEHYCPKTQNGHHKSSISLTYGHHGTEEGGYTCICICVLYLFFMGIMKEEKCASSFEWC